MKKLNDFTGIYPTTKSIAMELREVRNNGEISEKIREICAADKVREENRRVVIELMNDKYKQIVQESLEKLPEDWSALINARMNFMADKTESNRKEYYAQQKIFGDIVSSEIKNHPAFKVMGKAEAITDLIPDMIESGDYENKTELLETVESFKGFTTFFMPFAKKRELLFGHYLTTGSVANRIVSDNLPKFTDNIEVFETIKNYAPEMVNELQAELSEYLGALKVEDIFCEDYFSKTLTQEGITYYNAIIGGISTEKKHYKGFNVLSNEYFAKHPELKTVVREAKKSILMAPLFKQIMSEEKTLSFTLDIIENDSQLIEQIHGFCEGIKKNKTVETMESSIKRIDEYIQSNVYIRNKDITSISSVLAGNYNVLNQFLFAHKELEVGPADAKKKNLAAIEKYLKSEAFSIEDISLAIDENRDKLDSGHEKASIIAYIKATLIEKRAAANLAIENLLSMKADDKPIIQDEARLEAVKKELDAVMDFMHFIEIFKVGGELEKDMEFYGPVDEQLAVLRGIVPLYNKARNYLTKKPYSKVKYPMTFGVPNLGDGWDKSKERDNLCYLFKKDGLYYLGIANKTDKPAKDAFEDDGGTGGYQKMEYKQIGDAAKTLPHVFFSKTGIEKYDVPKYIRDNYELRRHKKNNKDYDAKFEKDLIDFYKEKITENPDWEVFDFNFKATKDYNSIDEFLLDVTTQGYLVSFVNVSEKTINELIDAEQLFFFQIYNKDFSEYSKGRDNLHTMYLKALFSDENIKDVVLKLNGMAHLFFREGSLKNSPKHKVGEKRVNRRDFYGMPIPDSVHRELHLYYNGRKSELKGGALSEEAQSYIATKRVVVKDFDREITKDKRFTKDTILFNFNFTINFKKRGELSSIMNSKAAVYLKDNKDVNILAIHRGETNLVTAVVMNRAGKILEKKNFNVVGNFDYQMKLSQIASSRVEARKSWKSLENIAQVKTGYLSGVISEIAKMMVKYNAILATEDLTAGYKNNRAAIEKNIYAQFEANLMNKLSYLVFKDVASREPGGILNGLQLTKPDLAIKDLTGMQGMCFFVKPQYISSTDPTTGFANVFNTSAITNAAGKKQFLSNFSQFKFVPKEEMFMLEFDYKNFKTYVPEMPKTHWIAYTNGERVMRYKNQSNQSMRKKTDITHLFKDALNDANIEYMGGEDLLKAITALDTKKQAKTINQIFDAVMLTFQIQNQYSAEGIDFVISPIKNNTGTFYDTRETDEAMPDNADTNAAYNIGLKAIKMLGEIDEKADKDGMLPRDAFKMDMLSWFGFVQNR